MPDNGPYQFLENYRAVLRRANISHPFGKVVRSGYWPALKKTDEEKAAEKERARFVDTNLSKDPTKDTTPTTATLWLGITEKDWRALQKISEANPHVKNYGVLVRRLIHAEAKRLGK